MNDRILDKTDRTLDDGLNDTEVAPKRNIYERSKKNINDS
jgi:hypothetical protein